MVKTKRMRWLSMLAAGCVLACAGVALAALETRAGDSVDLTGEFTEMVFAAGDDVKLGLTASDDVFATGDDVIVSGAKLDHAFIAAGDLTLQDFTAHDITAAAAEIDALSGEVADDFVAAAGRMKMAREARILGAMVVSGGELTLEAPVGGDLRAAGGEINLDADIAGNVYLSGGEIEIGPNTHIAGTLTHRARRIEISPEAQIDGVVTALTPHREPDFARMAQFATWAAISIAIGTILLAVIIALALPRLMNDVSTILRAHPFAMLGFGLAIVLFIPILIIFLLVSIFGAPLALFLGAAFGLMWMMALAGAAYTLGMFLRERVRHGAPAQPGAGERALWTAAALLAIGLTCLIPVLGVFVCIAATFLGLGAVTLQTIRALSHSHAA